MNTKNPIARNLLFGAFLAVPFGVCWGQSETPPEEPAVATEGAAEGAAAGAPPEEASVPVTALSAEYLAQLEERLQTLEDKLDLLITMQPRGTDQKFSRLTTQLSSEFRSVNQRLERMQRAIDQMRPSFRR